MVIDKMRGHNYDHGCGDICKKCGNIHEAWNKGLTKNSDERVRVGSEKASKVNKGRPSWKKGLTMETDSRIKPGWSKGLTKETDERIKKHSEDMKVAMKGRVFSSTHRANLSDSITKNWQKPEFRERMKESFESISGENSQWWRGGIFNNPYGPEFTSSLRRQIQRRDNNVCQIPSCDIINRLSVHHIDCDKKNSTPLNLITLCGSHHSKIHNDRDQDKWINYFQKTQEQRMETTTICI